MIKVALIVGHSEASKGAYSASLQTHEYTLWKEVALEACMEFRDTGLDAKVITRDGISIEKVGEMVNEWADLAIELHFNSAGKKIKNPQFGHNNQPEYITITDITPSGCETLYDADPVDSKLFAQTIHNGILKSLTEANPNYSEFRKDTNPWSKPKDRGVKLMDQGDRGYRNLHSVKIPSCLIEPFFGSNARDCQRFKINRAQFTRALVSSVLTYKILSK